jgi:hypothetical protein
MRVSRFWLIGATLIAFSNPSAVQAETIVAREVSGWFYSEGRMRPEKPTFEFVYEIEGSDLVRRAVRNLSTGKAEVDETRYKLLRDLTSFNREALRFKKLSASERPLAPVVRAISRPGSDAVEILFVGPDWVQSVKTVRDYMVINRCVRIQ